MSVKLLGGWDEHLARVDLTRSEAAARSIIPARLDLPLAAASVVVARSASDATALLAQLCSTPVAAIALDSEYGFARPSLDLRSGKTWNDIRTQRPVCVSLAAWLTATEPGQADVVLRAVLDVREPGVAEMLAEILRQRVPFVLHHAKVELFTFWSLGLDPDLPSLYDTYVAAACLHLGEGHKRARSGPAPASESEAIQSEAQLAAANEHRLSLLGQCAQYDIVHPFAQAKDELRERFAALAPGQALDERLVEYAAADADATLRVYVAQQRDVLREGIDSHLHKVEFPFVVANARIEWNGVHARREDLDLVRRSAAGAAKYHASILASDGIDPPESRPKFLAVMTKAGLADHFVRDGAPCTEDSLLETYEEQHPAIRALRMHRRYSRLAAEEWLTGALIGADGRIHPNHSQLGAATGRNSCKTPNIAGIGRVLRPVVSAPPGRALFEIDYSQIEVGIAAAEHNDPDLLAAYNSGDVYAAMAQRFYAGDLDADEIALAPRDFKRRRPDLRDRMKTFVLAVIYNIQAPAIAARFEIPVEHAERERERFLGMYPVLQRRLEESAVYGLARGYATVCTGLRRHVEPGGHARGWTRNFLRNTPIQGSAAVVFKRAIIALDAAFRGSPTTLVLPVHDAVLIECNLADLDRVAERAAQIMRDALHAMYPALQPRVDINKSRPECWNKEGHADSLERFLDDPGFRLEGAPEPLPTSPKRDLEAEIAAHQHDFEDWIETVVHFA